MKWTDGVEWRRESARQLAAQLAIGYADEPAIDKILADIGERSAKPGKVERPELSWYEIVRVLHKRGSLPKLLHEACAQCVELTERIAQVSADPPPRIGNPVDRYEVLLANHGRIPILDRHGFRKLLRDFIDNRVPVLIVNGLLGSGKTHSLELLQHVLSDCDEPRHVLIDFSSLVCGESARDLATIMRSCLGLQELEEEERKRWARTPWVMRKGTAVRRAIKMANAFVGDYNRSVGSTNRRIVVIDGLDRMDMDDDALILAAALIAQCAREQLVGCQLLITGFRGDLDHRTEQAVQYDCTSAITEADVRSFFARLHNALGKSPNQIAVDVMVADVMQHVHASDLTTASRKVRTASLELIGQR